jgi:arginase
MPRFALIDAPTNLGLRPTGVERLPEVLRAAGLRERLGVADAGRVPPLPYDPTRDPVTRLLNGPAIRTYSRSLADAVGSVLDRDGFPLVLAGDCSALLGGLLALRRRGRYGLAFLDGHADFYQPEAEPRGEVASMELALATGRGPDILADIDGLGPLVHDEDVVAIGPRDADEAAAEGSQDIRAVSRVRVHDPAELRARGVDAVAADALRRLDRPDLDGFWIHLDADVLDDAVMPAVDYRLPDGLGIAELSALLRALLASGRAVGMTVAIYNPALDPDGGIARDLVAALVAGLVPANGGEQRLA